MNTIIGKKIRLLRQAQHWSQQYVAEKLEISIPALSKIETGITDLNLSRLEQIANIFDLSIIQLITYDESLGISAYNDELNQLNDTLRCREDEIINLQRKVIELFEELKQKQVSSSA
ncbi:helix-turn-helix transcriptional regulator [Mucilaginibacter sp. HC2]|uniref:helix-turn-helix domain-containing protein n=1 Tax=Mucilaginibacter inviolabilis TaxID=2714892 RepID=UPI00140CDE72|nr:helix-turn-helix transcriptional regulator [Mucilaginibacter inviolabilis]NHA02691.1 helix-turn-helix transcriptional regulator [Mucilaginibacter inviolabilis]